MSLTHGELFAGISGMGLGMERAGIRARWHVEIDPHCQQVLRRHYPDDLILGDITTVSGRELPPVDIITFGSPCQDLSVAGKRAGFDGARSGLFFEATRIITEMREATDGRYPTFALWENVPGALSSSGGADFGAALDALAESGAVDIAWRIVDAQHWVPQRRRRVFTLALYPPAALGCAGIGRAAQILSLGEGMPGHPPARGEAWEGATYATAPSLTASGRGVERTGESRGQDPLVLEVANAITASAGHHGHSSPRGDGSDNLVVETLRSHPRPGSNSVGAIVISRRGREDGVSDELEEELAPKPGDPCHPLAAGAYVPLITGALSDGAHHGGGTNGQDAYTGRILAPAGLVRRLTPTECSRLQGFPDNWNDGQADSHRYRQLGNAVAVPCATWIARRIVAGGGGS